MTHVTLILLIDAERARVEGITKKPVTSVTGTWKDPYVPWRRRYEMAAVAHVTGEPLQNATRGRRSAGLIP